MQVAAVTPKPAKAGLLLLGHGSRDSRATDEFLAFARAFQEARPDLDVDHAHIELTPPDLKSALRSMAKRQRRIVIAPIFLFTSGHIKNDIPLIIDDLRSEFPRHEFLALDAIGPDARMVELLLERATPCFPKDELQLNRTGIIVVGRGSSDADANSDFFKLVRFFEETRPFQFVLASFIGITRPLLAQSLEMAARLRPDRLIVVPYFLFHGRLLDRIQKLVADFAQKYAWIPAELTAHLGDQSALHRLISEKIDRLLSGNALPLPCVSCEYREQLPGLAKKVGGLKAMLWSLRHLETHTQAGSHEFPHKKLTKHVLVCENVDCASRGSGALIARLRQLLKGSGRGADIRITRTSCMGRCGEGPSVVIYPDGVWYQKVQLADAEELVQEHLFGDRIVPRIVDTIMQ